MSGTNVTERFKPAELGSRHLGEQITVGWMKYDDGIKQATTGRLIGVEHRLTADGERDADGVVVTFAPSHGFVGSPVRIVGPSWWRPATLDDQWPGV